MLQVLAHPSSVGSWWRVLDRHVKGHNPGLDHTRAFWLATTGGCPLVLDWATRLAPRWLPPSTVFRTGSRGFPRRGFRRLLSSADSAISWNTGNSGKADWRTRTCPVTAASPHIPPCTPDTSGRGLSGSSRTRYTSRRCVLSWAASRYQESTKNSTSAISLPSSDAGFRDDIWDGNTKWCHWPTLKEQLGKVLKDLKVLYDNLCL